jgi:hypothetical protein
LSICFPLFFRAHLRRLFSLVPLHVFIFCVGRIRVVRGCLSPPALWSRATVSSLPFAAAQCIAVRPIEPSASAERACTFAWPCAKTGPGVGVAMSRKSQRVAERGGALAATEMASCALGPLGGRLGPNIRLSKRAVKRIVVLCVCVCVCSALAHYASPTPHAPTPWSMRSCDAGPMPLAAATIRGVQPALSVASNIASK